MEVQKEAQRIMTMSVWKMYHSRMQRGGLRLHRSLQLSLVMRNARDLYLSAKLEEEGEELEMAGTGGGGGAAEDSGVALQGDGAAPCAPTRHLERQTSPSPPPTPFPPPAQEEEEEGRLLPRLGPGPPEPMETQEGPGGGGGGVGLAAQPPSQTTARSPAAGPAKPSRKRRSSSLGKLGAAEAGLVPSKKAKLVEEEEGERQPQRQEGPFPSLARVLQDRFSGLILQAPPGKGSGAGGGGEPKAASCRQGEGMLSLMVRAVVAF